MTDDKKIEIWLHMLDLPKSYRGHGLTDRRCKRLRKIIWDDHGFGSDVIRRHGLDRMTIDELKATDAATYNHCVGNFWGMLYQDAIRYGVIKI